MNNALGRTYKQNKELHFLINKLGIPDDVKGDLVFQFTGGRSRSTADLKIAHAARMISFLREKEREFNLKNGFGKQPNQPKPQEDTVENKMRRKIISRCHEMNWRTPDGKADMKRLQTWLLEHGPAKKKLNDLTFEELNKTIVQFDNLLKSYYAKR